MKKAKAAGVQYAALPYRQMGRRLDILLVTSRETHRWVIPKGWPMKGLSPQEAAATEAEEEAGITGQIAQDPIGSFRYLKRMKDGQTIPIQVIVFPLLVQDRIELWKEQGQRQSTWFRYQQAAALVAEPDLRGLIRHFGEARSQGLWPLTARIGRWVDARLFGLHL